MSLQPIYRINYAVLPQLLILQILSCFFYLLFLFFFFSLLLLYYYSSITLLFIRLIDSCSGLALSLCRSLSLTHSLCLARTSLN